MNKYNCLPEMFEAIEEGEKWGKMPPLTQDNIRTLERRRWESLERLWGKFLRGGSSPRRTYLQIAHRYADVDEGYGSLGDE